MTSLHLRVVCRRRRLERELAAGAPPWTSPAHELCAAQLLEPATRSALARMLHNVLDAAEEAARGEEALSVAWREVEAQRRGLERLAAIIAGEQPVRAQGVALVARLLAERAGPLYGRCDELALQRRVRAALTALDVRTGARRAVAA